MKERLKKIRICEAPVHIAGCDGLGMTKDHFTPKSIAIFWGWTERGTMGPENTQWLSQACHKEKDRTTGERLAMLRRQLTEDVSLREHVQFFLGVEYAMKIRKNSFSK